MTCSGFVTQKTWNQITFVGLSNADLLLEEVQYFLHDLYFILSGTARNSLNRSGKHSVLVYQQQCSQGAKAKYIFKLTQIFILYVDFLKGFDVMSIDICVAKVLSIKE